jgi:hypothetical protein
MRLADWTAMAADALWRDRAGLAQAGMSVTAAAD